MALDRDRDRDTREADRAIVMVGAGAVISVVLMFILERIF